MLFVLDKSLADNLESPDVQKALLYIAIGRREGKHLIFSEDFKTMKAFAGHEGLTSDTREIYQNVFNRLSTLKSFSETVVRRVRVVAENRDISWKDMGEGKKEIIVSASLIRDSSFVQPTILLCEDKSDCELYEIMAKTNIRGKIIIRYDSRGGGGSQTCPTYVDIQNKRNCFCLCFADSDQKYPHGPLGTTAQPLMKITTTNLLSEFKIIDVREIENLIPTAMFDKVSDPNRIRCISFLEKLECSPIADARRFVDLKNGLKGREYFGLLAHNADSAAYWQKFFNTINSWINISESCLNNQACDKSKSENCACIIMYGLGEHILEAVIEMLNKQSPQKISEMTAALKPYWQEYGELISAWCCGSNRIST